MKNWLLADQKILSAQFTEQKLPHAILIQGVSGSGKHQLAQWLLELLLCQHPKLIQSDESVQHAVVHACQQCKTCLLSNSDSYPDHINLKPEKTSLGVDEIRQVILFMNKTAHLGEYKTILIEQAEKMTVPASNALLKTLEEPNGKSVIILLTADMNSLLPTIISRCRVINIMPPVGDDLHKQISKNSNVTNRQADGFDNISHLPELMDEKLGTQYLQLEHVFLSMINHDKAGKITTEYDLLTLLQDNNHSLRWLEKIVVNLLRQFHLNKDAQPNVSADMVNELYNNIQVSSKLVKSYPQLNHQMMLEQLIININNVITNH